MHVGSALATRARVTLVTATDFISCQHFPYHGGLNDVAESSWRRCDSAVHRLSRGRAPGLEQNSYFRAANRDSVHGSFGRGGLLGRPDTRRAAALRVGALDGSPHGASHLSHVYSGRFME